MRGLKNTMAAFLFSTAVAAAVPAFADGEDIIEKRISLPAGIIERRIDLPAGTTQPPVDAPEEDGAGFGEILKQYLVMLGVL
jgi:hypothetical protein